MSLIQGPKDEKKCFMVTTKSNLLYVIENFEDRNYSHVSYKLFDDNEKIV